MSNTRCGICGGLLSGQIETTADFWCRGGHPFPAVDLEPIIINRAIYPCENCKRLHDRIRELEKENENMRSDGKDVIIFCQEQISLAMKGYGKINDKAIENMYATECMTYGIIVDKLKKLLTPNH